MNKSILPRILACMILTFTFMGLIGSLIGMQFLSSPSMFQKQLVKQDAATQVISELTTKFQSKENATAIPATVYTDVLDQAEIEDDMQEIVAAYLQGDTPETDFSKLNQSITDYFETYVEENNLEKDDVYTQKLADSISEAESIVNSALDVYHFSTMKKANLLSKLLKLKKLLPLLCGGCAVISAVLIFLLRKKDFLYWLGTPLFGAGCLYSLGALGIILSGVIQQFAIKEVAVYTACTSLMSTALWELFLIGIICFVLGIVCITIHWKKQPKLQESGASHE